MLEPSWKDVVHDILYFFSVINPFWKQRKIKYINIFVLIYHFKKLLSRRQILLDKGVCTNNLQEGLKNFVGQSIETYQKRLSEEVLGQNDPDFTDDVGHRCVLM